MCIACTTAKFPIIKFNYCIAFIHYMERKVAQKFISIQTLYKRCEIYNTLNLRETRLKTVQFLNIA